MYLLTIDRPSSLREKVYIFLMIFLSKEVVLLNSGPDSSTNKNAQKVLPIVHSRIGRPELCTTEVML